MISHKADRYIRNAKFPPNFRPPHGIRRKPVKGGRWMVRKLSYHADGKLWRAWTRGVGQWRRSKYFETHAEAVAYAQEQAMKNQLGG